MKKYCQACFVCAVVLTNWSCDRRFCNYSVTMSLFAFSISPYRAVWGHETDGFWKMNSLAVSFLFVPCSKTPTTPTSSVPVHLWLNCHDAHFLSHVWCFSLWTQVLLHPLISVSLLLSLPPTHSICMLVFSVSSSSWNMRPCQTYHLGTLDIRLLFGVNLYIFILWCQVSTRLD